MKVLQVVWSKIAERFRNSLPFKLGVPTLVGGIIVAALAVDAGIRAGVMGDPAYYDGLILLSGVILSGLMGILWGLFWDKPDSPDEPR